MDPIPGFARNTGGLGELAGQGDHKKRSGKGIDIQYNLDCPGEKSGGAKARGLFRRGLDQVGEGPNFIQSQRENSVLPLLYSWLHYADGVMVNPSLVSRNSHFELYIVVLLLRTTRDKNYKDLVIPAADAETVSRPNAKVSS